MAESPGNKIPPQKSRNFRVVGKGVIRCAEEIGRGAESIIYRGSYQSTHVAVKVIPNLANGNEVNVLTHLEHANIIKCLYHEIVHGSMYIVLNLCKCNLEMYVESRRGQDLDGIPIPLSPIEVLCQVVSGVHYLHNGQTYLTVHRDLKPSNILFMYVERDRKWVVKISDFGMSKDIDQSKTSTNSDVKGSRGFMAPEVLKFLSKQLELGTNDKVKISKEADIFSLGIVFFYTLSDGKHPFGDDPLKRDENIRDSKPDLSELRMEYEHDSREIIAAMLSKRPEKRPTSGVIKAHFLFWSGKTTLEFYQEASDILNDRGSYPEVKGKLEKNRKVITGGDWKSKISEGNPAIKEALDNWAKPGRKITPQKDKVVENDNAASGSTEESKQVMKKKKAMPTIQELVRQIRNWAHHYSEGRTTKELREELGSYPDGLVKFFNKHFPRLLSHTYDVMKELRKHERLSKYYDNFENSTNKGKIEEKLACNFPTLANDSDDILDLDSDDESPSDDEQVASIEPRNYQLELAEQAKGGSNSLIIAPTGSGKTVVAYEIIRDHLKKSHAKSILFFVSKTTLALQQHRFFKCYLDELDEELIDYIIGETSTHAPTGAVLKGRRLVVLTPQILIDEMKRTRPSIKFSDFSLLIFDECHNATKKHPYKQVMDMLLDSQATDSSSIQVVGMTASLGVGRGRSQEKVLDNLLMLLANLNIQHCPVKVVKYEEELKQHQNEIKESHIQVRIRDDIYSKKILKAIKLLEERIRHEDLFGSLPNQVKEPPEDKTKQTYEQWVVNLIKHVQLRVNDRDRARLVTIYAEHLKMYYNLLYLKKHIPHAIDYTKDLASSDQDSEQGKFLRQIHLSLQKASINSEVPMLEKLFEELQRQFTENGDSRCIIFVPRKLIAKALTESIQNDENLGYLNPTYLTGSNEAESSGCMTKTDQENALQEFRDGKSRVLISTSVAEEGIDIRACNLVIMYNYVTGEVGRIQRAGRGRAENSKSILIAPCGSEQIEQERKNADCARASEEAIDDLKLLSDTERIAKIKKIQREQAKERRLEREAVERLLQEAKKWKIKCGSCLKELTTADQIKEIQGKHKFVMDPDFHDTVRRSPHRGDGKELTPGIFSTATFYCNDVACKRYIGLEMQHKKKRYPTLTVKQLLFEDEYGNRATCKQWNKCPFQLERYPDDSDDEEDEISSPRTSSKEGNKETVVEADTISNDTVYEYLNNWNHFVRNE